MKRFFSVLFVCFFMSAGQAVPGVPVNLDTIGDSHVVGQLMELFEDRSGQLSIEDVSSKEFEHRFVPNADRALVFGSTDTVVWTRLTIDNPSGKSIGWFLEFDNPLIGNLDLFIPSGEEGFTVRQTGRRKPFFTRDVDYRNVVFSFDAPPESSQTIYVRLQSEYAVAVTPIVRSETGLIKSVTEDQVVSGIFYGILLALLIYNFFISSSARETAYSVYSLVIVSVLFLMLVIDGRAFQYFWPNQVLWNAYTPSVATILFTAISMLFARLFLDTSRMLPRLDRILFWLMILYPAIFIPLLIVSLQTATTFAIYSGIPIIVFLMLLAFLCLRKGSRQARFFLLAIPFVLVGDIVFEFKILGLLPGNWFVDNSFKIGVVVEVLIFSIGLADRINTMKREKDEAQQTLIENLQKTEKLKDEFLATTSHELRTPLHGIIGIVESLISGVAGSMTEQMKANLELVVASSKRLSSLINDILDFSRLKNQDIILDKKGIDIKTLTDSVLEVSRRLIGAKNLEMINCIPPDLPYVLGSEDRLYQIMFNLVGNAIKFTDEGTITASAAVVGDKVEISVSDTGIGIPEAHFAGIFKSFEQVDSSEAREFGGTGLGLGITKKLVELHGGEIRVESIEGQGSTFYFTMPVCPDQTEVSEPANAQVFEALSSVQADATAEISNIKAAINGTEAVGEKKFQVLAVDDEPINLQVVANHLALHNITFNTASNGVEAIDKISSGEKPDLVLLDIMMPKMTGYEVCRKLREEYQHSTLPIIMLTAKNRVSDLIQGFQFGANDYIAKPFLKDELIARVQIQLKIKEAYETLEENLRLKNELEERKLAEIDMKILQRRLASMLDMVDDAVLAINENEKIHFCNSSFEALTGYTGRELLWRPFDDLFPSNVRKKLKEIRREISLLPGKPDQEKEHHEMSIVRSDNSELQVEMVLSPLELEEETFFVFIIRKRTALPSSNEPEIREGSGMTLIDELNRNRQRIQSLEEALNEGLPKLMANDEGFKGKLQIIDAALEKLSYSLMGKSRPAEKRKLAVELMNLSVDHWYRTTRGSKAELAQKSKIWKVYLDPDGRERTQTLDKYCDVVTLPQNPRWKNIVKTADFVLAAGEVESHSKQQLELTLAKFLAMS